MLQPEIVPDPPQEVPSDISECPECHSNKLVTDYDAGMRVCSVCGLVVSEEPVMSMLPDWDNKDNQLQLDRATPITDPGYVAGTSNSTKIGFEKFDAKSNAIAHETQIGFVRMSKLNSRAVGASAMGVRASDTARRTFGTWRAKLPSGLDAQIFDLFGKCHSLGLVKGRTIDQILVACTYHVLRENSVPTTLLALAEVTGIDKKDIARCYRLMIGAMKIKPTRRDPAIFISQFVSKLNLTGEFETVALDLYNRAKEKKITSGTSPLCAAACCCYLASLRLRLNIPQKTVADTLSVTEVSIRNVMRRLARGGIAEAPGPEPKEPVPPPRCQKIDTDRIVRENADAFRHFRDSGSVPPSYGKVMSSYRMRRFADAGLVERIGEKWVLTNKFLETYADVLEADVTGTLLPQESPSLPSA